MNSSTDPTQFYQNKRPDANVMIVKTEFSFLLEIYKKIGTFRCTTTSLFDISPGTPNESSV